MVDKSGAAPNESGEDLRSRAYSMFQGGKRIPKNSFWLGYLPSALFVDGLVTWWFPGAGAIYIGVCRGLYWLNGYKTTKMGAATGVNVAIEAIPFISALPGCSAFAAWTYLTNIAATKPPETESGKTSRTGQLASLGAAYALGRARPGGAAEKSATRGVGYEQKGARTGNGVVPPTTAADKNIGYSQKAGSDRTPTQPNRNADLNTPYKGDKNKNIDGMVPPEKNP